MLLADTICPVSIDKDAKARSEPAAIPDCTKRWGADDIAGTRCNASTGQVVQLAVLVPAQACHLRHFLVHFEALRFEGFGRFGGEF
jgi:hypothetical protein